MNQSSKSHSFRTFAQSLSSAPLPKSPNLSDGVVLYGCGELGKLALYYCQSNSIRTNFFMDRTCGPGKACEVAGLSVFNPADPCLSNYHEITVAICIATSSYTEIKASLIALGWKSIIPFYQLTRHSSRFFPLNNGWLIESLSTADIDKMAFVYDNLEDDCSREHYKIFLSWHSNYEERLSYSYPITTHNRYTIQPVLNFLASRSHNVVDVGAHHGQLLKTLTSQRIKIDNYQAFEPDPKAFSQLVTAIESFPVKSSVHSFCISSRECPSVRFFSNLGYCSKISSYGNSNVKSVTIDSSSLNPTIIKYHTEGSELDCIKGSALTISEHLPLLMVSLYHNSDGLYNTALFLMQNYPSYRYYLRLHSYQGTGLFLYAVPKIPPTH